MPFIIHWVESGQGEIGQFSLSTPVGELLVEYQGDVITATDWQLEGVKHVQTHTHPLALQLQTYLLAPTAMVPLHLLQQGTPFRNRVWAELCQIPFGTTLSYAALAQKIGSAARAVGNACRDNPYAFIVPCHRVVATKGLGGYCGKTAGQYMDIKTQLLNYEATNT